MRPRTLGLFLIGNRAAILELAADRRALWVGLLFVLSAGFAREYDGEYLVCEPWYLLIPVGASLVASFLLFVVACGPVFLRREGRPSFFSAYRQFLTLFWLTAPLAWFYAIPYERFLTPGTATSANLWTLAFVAAWRVALMVRVVSVVTGRPWSACLCLVMVFADAVALAAVHFMPKPIFALMGGVRQTESEKVVASATFLISCLGYLSVPVWVIGALSSFFASRSKWQVPAAAEQLPPSRGVRVLVACSLLVWVPILPFTQPEQYLRSRVERDLRAGRIAEALDAMSAHGRSDFPPGWEPPPRIGYDEKTPHILDVMEVLVTRDVAPWVRTEFVDKLRRQFGEPPFIFYNRTHDPDLNRITRILQRLPEGPEIAAMYAPYMARESPDERLSAEGVANKELLMKLAEQGSPPQP
ncbi:MAG: hypothetical protein J0I06_10440 [Planctomycetes bacterium]|nr:hypothetical protein [Planctomycetota bacterium]